MRRPRPGCTEQDWISRVSGLPGKEATPGLLLVERWDTCGVNVPRGHVLIAAGRDTVRAGAQDRKTTRGEGTRKGQYVGRRTRF